MPVYSRPMVRKRSTDGELAPLQLELREAMGQWGCPLCRLAQKAERAYVDSVNYERVLDLNTRDALKASRGMCRRHTRMWEDVQGAALGLAIVYRISVLDLLRDTEPDDSRGSSLFRRQAKAEATAAALDATAGCPACEVERGAVHRFGTLLLQDIEDPEVQAALEASGGLCLPHLRAVLGFKGAERAHDALMRTQRAAWQTLMGQLEEFIRKNDYRFRHEAMTPEEGTSWRRVLDVIVGLKDRHA
jgi:hypothetical protein